MTFGIQYLRVKCVPASEAGSWRLGLTSADGPVVAPRSQGVGDSLAGDTLGSLQDVAVIAAELDAGADSAYRDRHNRNNNL